MSVIDVALRIELLEQAFAWCCKRRKKVFPDADIWDVRFHWEEIKNDLLWVYPCGLRYEILCGEGICKLWEEY